MQELGGLAGERAEPHEFAQVAHPGPELADVDRPRRAGDVGDRDVQPRSVGQRGVDERRAEVDAATGGLQHPLDEVAHLGLGELERDALRHPVAGDEDAVGRVDPDLLDRRVVEERLQRAEPGEGRDHLTRRRALVGEHGQRAAERALAVAPHLVAHVAVGEVSIAGEVDAVAAHALAHLLGDEADRAGHAVIVGVAPDAVSALSTGVMA